MHTFLNSWHENNTGYLDSPQTRDIERKYGQANHSYHFPRKKSSDMNSDDGQALLNVPIYDLHSQNRNKSPTKGRVESNQTLRHKILSIKQIKQYKRKESLVKTGKLTMTIKNSPLKSRSTSRGLNLSLSKTKKQIRSAFAENNKNLLSLRRTPESQRRKRITLYSNRKCGEVSQFSASSPVTKEARVPINKNLAQVRTINIYN